MGEKEKKFPGKGMSIDSFLKKTYTVTVLKRYHTIQKEELLLCTENL